MGGVNWVKENKDLDGLAKAVEKNKSKFAGTEILGKNILVIGTFISGQSTNNSESQQKDESGMPFDPEMLLRLMSIIEKLNSNKNDPRCNLIAALKPLLSERRRQKADLALELMRIFSIFSDDNIFSV